MDRRKNVRDHASKVRLLLFLGPGMGSLLYLPLLLLLSIVSRSSWYLSSIDRQPVSISREDRGEGGGDYPSPYTGAVVGGKEHWHNHYLPGFINANAYYSLYGTPMYRRCFLLPKPPNECQLGGKGLSTSAAHSSIVCL